MTGGGEMLRGNGGEAVVVTYRAAASGIMGGRGCGRFGGGQRNERFKYKDTVVRGVMFHQLT